ncbi:FAD-dependent oxidoreductase [Tessaracoccus lapidicaptus]|uniref:FAD-dependent oxidoreductase n=1 Tax=Tessaracoccus lapidicaptus TaxID=1427523 RepID=UPI00334145DA
MESMTSVWFATHPAPHVAARPFPEGSRFDTVVAGAGLTGLATAALLARAGHRVAVVEARSVGAVATGNTTAKVSLLQGSTLSDIRSHQSDEVLAAYVDGNREAQAWLARFLEERDIEFQSRTAYTFAFGGDGVSTLEDELAACRAAGLTGVTWTTDTGLPFDVSGALALPDQLQIHPLVVLDALLEDLVEHGGVVIEGVRVTDAEVDSSVKVTTTAGGLEADQLILATGTPILDRGGYFAKLEPHRSYATTYRVPGAIPQGMYLSVDGPGRSLRTVPVDDGELLMVGGNGHVVGRTDSEAAAVADLRRWTAEHFPGAEPTHAWSAQDYRAVDRVPYVGELPRGEGRIFVATGYNKWGMTNGVAAALMLSGRLLDGSMPWADVLGERTPTSSTLLSALAPNAKVAATLAKDWVQAEVGGLPDEPPAEGEGVVGRGPRGVPEAVSTVDGVTCRVSGICTHLGGVVRWNDAEKSWDCPLHGSRFAHDGSLLEGPAVADLPGSGG